MPELSRVHAQGAARTRSRRTRARRATRGFTLLELMVVVILIGLLAFMAVPSMSAAGLDRRVHEDAANIQDLIREARARAMGRGGAVMVSLDETTTQFRSWEVRSDLVGGQNLPLVGCKAPTDWATATNLRQVGNADMGTYQASNHIKPTIFFQDGTSAPRLFLCFTPQGRTFVSTTASFDPAVGNNAQPLTGALRVQVKRTNSDGSITYGIVRSVLIPPTGAARVVAGS